MQLSAALASLRVSADLSFAKNGECFQNRLKDMGITGVLTAPQSPWQNPFAERLVGSIRREC